MDNKTLISAAALLGVSSVCAGIFAHLKKKTDREEFTKNCIYMAVLDDEISRKELDGKFINGCQINFPPKRESLYYRYELFSEMFAGHSKRQMIKEIRRLEERLHPELIETKPVKQKKAKKSKKAEIQEVPAEETAESTEK